MKFLHLVLYSPAPYYDKMMQYTRTWYARFEPDVKTLYYYGDPSLSEPVIDEEKKLLILPMSETYIPGILNKTIAALEFFFAQKDIVYDFVIRSNISSVLNFPHLLPLLQNVQHALFFGSTLCSMLAPVSETTKIICDIVPNLRFAHGTCLFFHPRAIEFLLSKKQLLRQDAEDDVTISLLFTQTQEEHKGLFLPRSLGLQYAGFNATGYNFDNVSCFRNHHFGSDRSLDVVNVERITKAMHARHDLRVKPSNPIKMVTYGDKLDVTKYIILLCKVATNFVSDNDNSKLDYLFTDPSPGIAKVLQVTFADGSMFVQGAALTFFLQNKELCVK